MVDFDDLTIEQLREELLKSWEREGILQGILDAQPWCWDEVVDRKTLLRLWPAYAVDYADEEDDDA